MTYQSIFHIFGTKGIIFYMVVNTYQIVPAWLSDSNRQEPMKNTLATIYQLPSSYAKLPISYLANI